MTTFKLFGAKKAVAWVLDQDDALGAAISDTTGLSITLASGDGANYATASLTNPHKIMVDSEVMWIVGRADDVLTVGTGKRGADGSTAATHLNGAAVKHFRPVRVPKTNAFSMDGNIETLEFPGDGDVERVYQSNGISGEIGLSKYDTDILQYLAGAAAVVAGLHSDEASRNYPEQGTYPYCELHIDLKAENETTGANGTVRIIVFSTKLQDPMIIGEAGNNEPQLTTFQWSANAVTTDLLGRALPGVTEPVHYAYSVLA